MPRVINNKMDQKGNTNITVHKYNYLWTINNFTFGFKTLVRMEKLTSPTFTTGKNNKLLWNLILRIKNMYCESHLALILRLVSNNKEHTDLGRTILKFSMINDKDEVLLIIDELLIDDFGKCSEISVKCITKNFVFDKKNGILADDKLRILCEVSVLGDISTCLSNTIQVPESGMSDDFRILFETKKFSDAILSVADGKEVQVHKSILAARSPVFAAMFEHEMKELKDNHVKITDVDYEILHELLRFIYTGKVENLEIMAEGLLAAANKYDLQKLKVLCEKELYKNLSTENATEILLLAYLHGADQLKTECCNFINANTDVFVTIGWKQLKEKFPQVIAEVYEALVTSKIPLIGL